MARALDGNTKVSLRTANNLGGALDLKKMIDDIIMGIGNCEAGGHQNAAGAIIPTEKESMFIEAAKEVLGRHAVEEKIG